MQLIDSNIIVYSYLPEYNYLRLLFVADTVFVSAISRVEVLGYHKITSDEELYFTSIFELIPIISPSQEIFDLAIKNRKKYNLSLGDSIIAATAQINKLSICTSNLQDFERVEGLTTLNPIS